MVELTTVAYTLGFLLVVTLIAIVGAYAKGRADGEASAVNKSKLSLLADTLRK